MFPENQQNMPREDVLQWLLVNTPQLLTNVSNYSRSISPGDTESFAEYIQLPTISDHAHLEWLNLQLTQGSDGQNHLYYLTTGGPEGRPARFALRITNNSDKVFYNSSLLVRLRCPIADGSFTTVNLQGQTGNYKQIDTPRIQPGQSYTANLQISRDTLRRAYETLDPNRGQARLEVEFHWWEGHGGERRAYKRSHPLGFFLFNPIEFKFNTTGQFDGYWELTNTTHQSLWKPVYAMEFTAHDRQPVNVQMSIQTTVANAETDEVSFSSSRTVTTGTQVSNTQTDSGKLSFGAEDVIKLGLELQTTTAQAVQWSASIADQVARAARYTRAFTESFTHSQSITTSISPLPGRSRTFYLCPVLRKDKVNIVRFDGPNAEGQATRRTEYPAVLVTRFSHWIGKIVP